MPRKGDKVYCVNHPDEAMIILNEKDANTFHTIRLGFLKRGYNYGMHDKSTGFDVFSCKQCGYAEFYITAKELHLLKEPEE